MHKTLSKNLKQIPMLNNTAAPSIIGVSGYTLAGISPQDGAQWVIAATTALAQLIAIFKPIFKKKTKQKNETPQS